MQPGAEIVVNNFASRLAFQDVLEQGGIHGCVEMWEGITVNPGAELYMENNNLSEAINGVTMDNESVIDLIENKFSDNYISLYTEPGDTKLIYANGSSSLINNEFIGASLLPPHTSENSQAGIFLNNTVMEIGQSNDQSNINTFTALNNGIIANESNIGVHRTTIENLPNTAIMLTDLNQTIGTGILLKNSSARTWSNIINSSNTNNAGIIALQSSLDTRGNFLTIPYAIELLDCNNEQFFAQRNVIDINSKGSGILIYNSDAISSAIMENNSFTSSTTEPVDFILVNNPGVITTGQKEIRGNNTFSIPEDNQRAVYLINVGGWEVSKCHINYTGTGNTSVQGTIGIVAFGCTEMYFSENDINATNLGAFYHGLMLSNTTESRVCCSTINNGHTNMTFFGHCEGSTTRHTDIKNATIGLNVWPGTVIGQFNPPSSRFEHQHTGNLWNGNYSLVGAQNTGNDIEISNSVFLIEGAPQSSAYWPPNVSTPSSLIQWFVSSGGNAENCNNDGLCPSTSFTEEEIETELDRFNEYNFIGQYSEMLNWERNQYRLSVLNEISDLQSVNSELHNFISMNYSTELGQYQAFRNATREQYQYSSEYYLDVNELHELEANLVETYVALDETIDETVIDELLEEKQVILNDLALIWDDFISLKNFVIDVQKQQALALAADNNNLPTNSVITQNEQIVNNLFLAKVVTGTYSLSASEFALIRPIAEQCVMEGGKVVYRARALYQLAEKRFFEDNCSLIQALQSSTEEEKPFDLQRLDQTSVSSLNEEIRIYPNPTKHFLHVELPTGFVDTNFSFKLLSVTGQVLQYWTADQVVNRKLNIEGIPAGIYWLSIAMDNDSFVNRRVVILP